MSRKCELSGKSPLKGHKVSHANNKAKRKFLPNLKSATFRSDILKKVLDMNEDDRVELLLLLEDYHKEYQKNMCLHPSIDNHDFIEYGDVLKNTCYQCFNHKLLHLFRNHIKYK